MTSIDSRSAKWISQRDATSDMLAPVDAVELRSGALAERAKAQGANDLAVFVMMTLSSFTSGLTVTSAGWEKVNLAALPMIGAVLVAITWLALRGRSARRA